MNQERGLLTSHMRPRKCPNLLPHIICPQPLYTYFNHVSGHFSNILTIFKKHVKIKHVRASPFRPSFSKLSEKHDSTLMCHLFQTMVLQTEPWNMLQIDGSGHESVVLCTKLHIGSLLDHHLNHWLLFELCENY